MTTCVPGAGPRLRTAWPPSIRSTSTVRATGRLTSIPYAALIYNEEGDTYTYVSRKPLVFVRVLIGVDHIANGRVVLKHGPPLGTRVVTTGAAEVYSAEFGVEE